MATMIDRVIRAAKLDVDLYNEVEADTSLNQEALMVVIIVSAASGIGSLIGGLIQGTSFGSAILGLIISIIMGVIGYYIWAYVTYFVGTNLFGGTADPGELLRVLGYASGPQILGIIPCVGFIGGIWALVTGVIAIREALDFDTGKAIITTIIGWVIVFVITMIVLGIVGVGGFAAMGAMGGGG